MTSNEFRRIALSFPETEERAHMNHPDFRVCGKIFATLGYPNKDWGMVKLTLEQQAEFVHDEPRSFDPCAGAWGRKGATSVRLKSVKKATLQRALEAAWRNTAPKKLAQSWKSPAAKIRRTGSGHKLPY
jgi:hypothetical protein